MSSTAIDYQVHPAAPVPGAAKVWWIVDGFWVHKGWLMPDIILTGDRNGEENE